MAKTTIPRLRISLISPAIQAQPEGGRKLMFYFLGSMKTKGSAQWTKFVQDGDLFQWDAGVQDVAATSWNICCHETLTIPTRVRVQALMSVSFLLAAGAPADNPAAVSFPTSPFPIRPCLIVRLIIASSRSMRATPLELNGSAPASVVVTTGLPTRSSTKWPI